MSQATGGEAVAAATTRAGSGAGSRTDNPIDKATGGRRHDDTDEVTGDRPALRGWFHVGALVAVLIAGPLLIASGHGAGERVALMIYIVSLLALFGVSAAFHRITWSPEARRRMRRADHSTIFVGIAGTYTAVAVTALHGWAELAVLLIAWVGAAVGIGVRQFLLDAPKWAVSLPYLVVGWTALVAIPQLVRGLGGAGFTLIVVGGLAYTAGAIVYALRRPNPVPAVFGYHEVFHACTIVGATLNFIAIAAYGVPRH